MEEKRLDVKSNLDILNYWKGTQFKYPQVACMARDILSILITTVASKSVFSVGGRVLDHYRSSLKPDTVEPIICTRDWLFGKKKVLVICLVHSKLIIKNQFINSIFFYFRSHQHEMPTNALAKDFLNVDHEV